MYIMPPCFKAGDTIYFFFDTYDSNGASVTITGLAVTDIEIYKNGSTTTRASDNGYTLLDTDGIDFASTTGLHGFSIDTSNNSDAGFWADGNQYLVNVNAITCDSQTVRFSYFLTLGLAGDRVRVFEGTVNDAGATATVFIISSGFSASDDTYNKMFVQAIDGTYKTLMRPVSDYTGSTKTITLSEGFPAALANGTKINIFGFTR